MSRSHGVKNCPLLGRERDDGYRRWCIHTDVSAEGVLRANICDVLEALNAWSRDCHTTKGNTPNFVPPRGACIGRNVEGRAEHSGGREPDVVEHSDGEVEWRRAAASREADGCHPWVHGCCSAKRDNEKAGAAVLAIHNETSHHDCYLGNTEGRRRCGHESWRRGGET